MDTPCATQPEASVFRSRCASHIAQRDAELASTTRAYNALRAEFDEYKRTRRRHDANLEAATHEKVDGLLKQREDAAQAARSQESQADALRAELTGQLASSPPGALEAARLANKRAPYACANPITAATF